MILFLFAHISAFSQESPVSVKVDTAQIKIGEQIIYELLVETQPEKLVVFPENESFSPMEVVEALKIDTTRTESKFQLLKKYALTKFDSGHYVIPKQKIMVDGKSFFSDSILIEVNDVVVDTIKQKLYPIKPRMEIPQSFKLPDWVWWILGLLLLIGIGLFAFLRRKKKKEEAEAKLPPYEQALVELEQLDRSALLENRELKEYYSQLASVVRKYLDGKVYDHALESTTGELIAFLEMKKEAGELLLDRQTISELKIILQRADLAKFANTKPDVITAKSDRASAEKIINETKTAVPEPSEEELLKNQKYQEKLAQKRKKKKIIYWVSAGIIVILIGISVLIATIGTAKINDYVFGNNTKELLEGDWITSSYGTPPMTVTTPEVLVREDSLQQKNNSNPTNFEARTVEVFSFGKIEKDLYINLATMTFSKDVTFTLETTVDNIAEGLEDLGAKNILVKDEIFTTMEGIEGLKISGSFVIEDPESKNEIKMKYLKLHFATNNGFQSIFVSYNSNDENADEIAQRIVNSVEFKRDGQ